VNLHASLRQLLQEIGPGRMMNTAYDTAWVARLAELDEPIGEQALEWLRANQLSDGGWGSASSLYYHDRLICTLAAMTALAKSGRAQDRIRWQRATLALEQACKGLNVDTSGATIGFEMIVPTLMAEAEAMGLIERQDDHILGRLAKYRNAKLASLPGGMINRRVTVSFSAEMVGPDGLKLLDVEHLQEENGSVAYSPAATAYYALYVQHQDPAALRYLRQVTVDGGAPNVSPFDVFEQAWTLWNLSLSDALDDELIALCQPHLDFLEQAWQPGRGASFSARYAPKDGDDTSMAFEALLRFGRSVDRDAILSYEQNDHFVCYHREADPSTSVNVHVLGALRQAGLDAQHPAIRKIARFLQRTQTLQLFWFDKWHVSPYYPTAHAVIACAGYSEELVRDAVYWIAETQNPNGSWGYYMPTAEETAYCLQALAIWKQHCGPVPDTVLKRGVSWLSEHIEPPYPPLWIGKCLYCPKLVVRSSILSALAMATQV
jgi:halimadienyl-diphosphate synthase